MLSTQDLDQGPPPSVPYLAATDPAQPPGTWSLVRPSGETVRLTVDRPFGFASLGDDLVVLVEDGERTAAVLLDATGTEVTRQDALGYRLAVSANAQMVAWLAPDRSVHGIETARGPFELPAVDGGIEIGALIGYDTCFEAESDVGGCTAFVNVGEPRQAWLTSSHGIVDVAGSMLSVVDAAEGGRVVGLTSLSDQGSCSAVFVRQLKPRWETCDHTLTGFSPQGTRVLGTDTYLDGLGQRTVALFDKQGGLLHGFTSKGRGPTVLQTAWEDEDNVLAVVYERGQWSVVRLGTDGSAEMAIGVIEGSDFDRPFILEQG